jgi:hypothetical protein
MFGRSGWWRRTDALTERELRDWVDDVEIGSPIDTGAEDEVRALMEGTPLPLVAGNDYEDTVPRALPPRVPQAWGLRALWVRHW